MLKNTISNTTGDIYRIRLQSISNNTTQGSNWGFFLEWGFGEAADLPLIYERLKGKCLTQWQFEACVEQDPVERWVFGAADLIVSHDDLWVESQPLPWTLLWEYTHKMNLHLSELNEIKVAQSYKNALFICFGIKISIIYFMDQTETNL